MEVPEIPRELRTHVTPHTISVLKLIASTEGIGPETLAGQVLDKFASEYSGKHADVFGIERSQIDEAAQEIEPRDR